MTTRKKSTPRRAPAKKAAATAKAPAKPPRAPRKTVLAAVNRDLAALAKLDKDLAISALAATAQALAREIDDSDNSPTSKATCARALAETLSALREMAPKNKAQDGVDEISARRAARRARSAGS